MTYSEGHFDAIAEDYDYWKKKNAYYHENLKALYGEYIPKGERVLEIGCGTGDILARLEPKEGRGVDVSEEMVEIARRKYSGKPNLQFEREDIFESAKMFGYPYIFLADVLEHVGNLEKFMQQLAARTDFGSTVVISVANPLWEPVLMLAEKLHMKMPEGPHTRDSIQETERIFRESGFTLAERGFRLLVPKKIPGSDWVNARFHRLPLLRRLGFVVYWVLKC
ncbi:class I SAM-dependent methyltransferase [Candidatus Kaiserbacteria bacterium]|nr:class I SAM-dependent methyltransferase [Candidatus Kaiserbacteria bacterium]